MTMILTLSRRPSPLGVLSLLTDAAGALRALEFEGYDDRRDALLARQYGNASMRIVDGACPPAIADALEAYFAGDLTAIDALPAVSGGTPFQKSAWAALRTIPAGQTRSYAEQAAAIGRPAAVRAIGLANGANPIAVVVPCHRVIGADGRLTGYGGGLDRKLWLLRHEGASL